MARPVKGPTYLRHRPSGQARCVIDGKTIYLGAYDSPESHQRFASEVAKWRSGVAFDTRPAKVRTVADLLAAWHAHSTDRYARPGGQSKELVAYRYALRPVYLICCNWPVADFGPLALARVREALARGYQDPEHGQRRPSSRKVVNRHLVRIRTVWRWAESMELVAAGSWARLRTLPGLARGDALAIEREKVKPAPDQDIDCALAAAAPVVEALGAVLYWSGARPSELFRLRIGDVDRSGPIWFAVLTQHKTARLGKPRVVYFGPHAQRWLAGQLVGAAGCLVFPNRKGHAFTPDNFRQAVLRAAERAGVESFYPYQLRHSAATRIKAECGWDAARILLGHSSVDTTVLYAEDQREKATDAARKAG